MGNDRHSRPTPTLGKEFGKVLTEPTLWVAPLTTPGFELIRHWVGALIVDLSPPFKYSPRLPFTIKTALLSSGCHW